MNAIITITGHFSAKYAEFSCQLCESWTYNDRFCVTKIMLLM